MEGKAPLISRCFAMWGLILGMCSGSAFFGIMTLMEAAGVGAVLGAMYPVFGWANDRIDEMEERS